MCSLQFMLVCNFLIVGHWQTFCHLSVLSVLKHIHLYEVANNKQLSGVEFHFK